MINEWIIALKNLKRDHPTWRAAIIADAEHVKVSVSCTKQGGRVFGSTKVITADETMIVDAVLSEFRDAVKELEQSGEMT